MTGKVYLAVDLGAESGRVIAGIWNGRRLRLEEVHRFPNGGVVLGDSLRWDLLRLWAEIQTGLALAQQKHGRRIVSVGADTWGVDFVLLNRQNEILGQPYHYRDARTRGALARAFKQVPRAAIFAQSGLQFLEFNSLYQLLAWQRHAPELLAAAQTLLFIPDFLHWALCGVKRAEFTIASTSQFVHPRHRSWSLALLKQFGLPAHFLPKIVPPGTTLGPLRKSLAAPTGLVGVKVVAPPSHDTASAVAGVPTAHTGKANWAYLSSGTWSLLGVEVSAPVLSRRALELNLTNEGGIDGTYRLLKNIMGLWLVQQCRRALAAGGKNYNYDQLAALAAQARPGRSLVDANDPRFLNPPHMPRAIQDFCRETRQPLPRSAGELVRCCYDSLALKYRETLAALEELTATPCEVIHIVGGGSQSELLNQLTADACQRPVVAGPVEATALGNLLTQVRADGELRSLAEMRAVVRASSSVRQYDPRPAK
ncbi:MAG TPA: rhamnulokinase family protein [Verrucomicrobiota bacterium]|nr:rhamnulokinase family protein [Verrucomicrobiota bacterium]HNT14438.1 rhamnulokinase family protein [Verrucomicrobiota bacterium]